MKNLFLLPTDKPSRFVTSKENKKCYLYSIEEFKDIDKFIEYDSKSWDSQNIYITSDEEIKEGDWYYNSFLNEISKMDILDYSNFRQKIILTTDQDLIKEGVQTIDDEFLEWFVKNPSCEEVEVKCYSKFNDGDFTDYKIIIPKQEKIYSEEEMLKMLHKFGFDYTYNYKGEKTIYEWIPEWFEEYKRLEEKQ